MWKNQFEIKKKNFQWIILIPFRRYIEHCRISDRVAFSSLKEAKYPTLSKVGDSNAKLAKHSATKLVYITRTEVG